MAALCWRAAAPVAATSSRSATREPSVTPRLPNPASGGDQTFPRTSRILRSADFRAVYDHGTRLSGPLFAAFCLARQEPDRVSARLGLTVPRAVGKAVVRNRIKRRIREIFRKHRANLAPQWDVVINPRHAAADVPFADLERAFGKVFEKCKVSR